MNAAVRHLILLVLSVTLGWLSTEVVPVINDAPGWGVPIGGLVAAVLAYVTPLVNAYGVGSQKDTTYRQSTR